MLTLDQLLKMKQLSQNLGMATPQPPASAISGVGQMPQMDVPFMEDPKNIIQAAMAPLAGGGLALGMGRGIAMPTLQGVGGAMARESELDKSIIDWYQKRGLPMPNPGQLEKIMQALGKQGPQGQQAPIQIPPRIAPQTPSYLETLKRPPHYEAGGAPVGRAVMAGAPYTEAAAQQIPGGYQQSNKDLTDLIAAIMRRRGQGIAFPPATSGSSFGINQGVLTQ